MLRNHLLTTFRIFKRSKIYTLINLIGLSIGLGVFIVVSLYLEFEYGYDKHFNNSDNIYRVTTDMIWEEGTRQVTAVTPGLTAYYFKEEFPEIEATTRFIPEARSLIEVESQFEESIKFYEDNVVLADSTFFGVFDLPFYAGNKKTALKSPNSIIISKKTSEKLFGKPDARGETIRLNDTNDYMVTGIIENVPENSHIKLDIIASGLKYPVFTDHTWRDLSFYTYAVINNKNNISTIESKFDSFFDKHLQPYKGLLEFRFQKMTDIHLRNDREFDNSIVADPDKLNVLMIIAILVLILANFNFINLSTAQASYRNKEISIRKINGARKSEIILQLLTECIILSITALFIVIFLAYNFESQIKSLLNINFSFDPFRHITLLLLLTIITSVISGIYPAILMSKFHPLRFLQTNKIRTIGKAQFRNILIVFQFATTIALLISLSIIYQQMNYIKHKDLGFDKDQILTTAIWNDSTYQTSQRLKEILSSYNEISSISTSSFVPGGDPFYEHFKPEGYESHLPLKYINVDPEYLKTLDIQLVLGRNFHHNNEADKKSVIINEAAMKTFGWNAEDVIGKKIEYNFSQSWEDLIEGKVIGVIQDFNYGPLREKVAPLVLTMHQNFYPVLIMKIKGNNIKSAIDKLTSHYDALNNNYPLEYTFLDEKINVQYKSEQYFSNIMVLFTILAITISSLGLFGLSSFMMEKRMKEISIRKIHGASFRQLYLLFSGDFMKWILVSLLFALPVSWYFSQQWLSTFAYSINFNINSIIFAIVTSMIVVTGTISYHAFIVALKNPSTILRSE